MKINFSQEEFYNMGFTDDMLDGYDEWPPRDSTQVKISKEKKKKCEVVKLPITSSENNMKNKKCDYKTLAIMTLYSNFNQDEDHRYIYKNDIILNKDEIETLSKNKIDTIMRNVKKLCKLESKVVEAKNTDNGIVYLINYGEENNDEYGYKTYRKYVTIEEEMKAQVEYFKSQGKLIEAQRIEERTNFDIEMMRETGFCQGIENYSRHISGREPGSAPYTLFDYFPKDFLLLIDESHATIPQEKAMYNGDRARKEALVKYGFRLPSAFDNRPLKFEEFEQRINQCIFVSATPADYEKEHSKENVVEQIIRPTGLLDPKIEVKPVTNQVDDLIEQIRIRTEKRERVLVTTLTKKMAEDLSTYLAGIDIKVKYMHSDTKALERMEIIRDLRLGQFDVLVGINLLREGLDIPEVSLVAILDADKEGFLRSERSLIQTIGRAARNTNGKVIMYADELTESMEKAISETNRRRKIQEQYNKEHNITPKTIQKSVRDTIKASYVAEVQEEYKLDKDVEIKDIISKMTDEMLKYAADMEFEKAAEIRDKIKEMEKMM